MEPLLNTFWVLLAAAGTGGWIAGRRKHALNDGFRLRGLLVLSLLTLLSFPVISMTDDRYCDQFVMEDASSSCNLMKMAGFAKAPACYHHHAADTAMLASTGKPFWRTLGPVWVEQKQVLSFTPVAYQSGRAPPYVFPSI